MPPKYEIRQGDVLEVLAGMPDYLEIARIRAEHWAKNGKAKVPEALEELELFPSA